MKTDHEPDASTLTSRRRRRIIIVFVVIAAMAIAGWTVVYQSRAKACEAWLDGARREAHMRATRDPRITSEDEISRLTDYHLDRMKRFGMYSDEFSKRHYRPEGCE